MDCSLFPGRERVFRAQPLTLWSEGFSDLACREHCAPKRAAGWRLILRCPLTGYPPASIERASRQPTVIFRIPSHVLRHPNFGRGAGRRYPAPAGVLAYFKSVSTELGTWFACANIATEDCIMMLFRVYSTISSAMSASRMTDSAFVNSVKFTRSCRRLASKPFFWKAPMAARMLFTSLIESSTITSADCAPLILRTSMSCRFSKFAWFTTPRARLRVFVLSNDTEALCPGLGPIWNTSEFWYTVTRPADWAPSPASGAVVT